MIFSYITWSPDPELFNLFGISIRYYGLLFAIGLALAVQILKWMYKREDLPLENLEKLTIYGAIGILAGARLGHCLFYEPDYYLSRPWEMILPFTYSAEAGFNFTGYQGLASHGGVLGLLIASYLYSKKTKHNMLEVFDMVSVAAGVAFVFIRLANFMNSEIIGKATGGDWGVVFENVDNIPRHPAQLYEAGCYLIVFLILISIYRTKGLSMGRGFYFGLATILFFIGRILVEFVKENQVAFEDELTFNMGQLLSVPYILIGIGFLIYAFRQKKAL